MKKFFALLFAALLLLSLNVTPFVREIRGYVSFLLNPLSFTLLLIGDEAKTYTTTVTSIRNISSENTQLKENLFNTQSTLVALYDAKNADEFEKIQKDYIKGKGKLVTAEVVGQRNEDGFVILQINKGLESDIQNGDTVFENGYLLGVVNASFPYKSDVKVVVFSPTEIPAKTANTETTGVYYCKNNECFFDKVLTESKLKEGDIVVTSGVSGVYKSGLILGEIVNISESPEKLFKTAVVQSFLNVDQVARVGVITNE